MRVRVRDMRGSASAISGRCGRASLLLPENFVLSSGGRLGRAFTLSLTDFLPESCTTSCYSERATPSRTFSWR